MTNTEFFLLLKNNRLISGIWDFVLSMIRKELNGVTDVESYLNLFTIYFSLIDDGNICMSLDSNILQKKWEKKINDTAILLQAEDDARPVGSIKPAVYNDTVFDSIRTESNTCINNFLSNIAKLSIVGPNTDPRKMFYIENNWLYAKKYYDARNGIRNKINLLFNNSSSVSSSNSFNYKAITSNFTLAPEQGQAVNDGLSKNLIITGGPGTGKTTTILFLLLNLLSSTGNYMNYDIYLCAPSGKAANRMQESIIKGFDYINDTFKNKNSAIINKITNLESYTIHRLLGTDFDTGGFTYNAKKQFASTSIFIVDEASMIDICLFNSLIQAIPVDSRLFIMGDKNQLPSVECGAVFAELLEKLPNNVCELTESIRFGAGTDIDKLAKCINSGSNLSQLSITWNDPDTFTIQSQSNNKPIYYFNDSSQTIKTEKDIIDSISRKWADAYYKKIMQRANNLSSTINETDLKDLMNLADNSRILCAENDGYRGKNYFNKIIRNYCAGSGVTTHIPGELAIITKNNKSLDLYNGDCGILVTFDNDNTLYFMIRKASSHFSSSGKPGTGTIFQIGDFLFYPYSMIAESDKDIAYAITIHKSQGSDYNNILVVLPKKPGHPLLNRQIIYTAITRTKGNTYIISNQDRLIEAKDNVIKRDTNIN